MVTAHPDTELDRRHLTIDYSSGHVLIDGRPIGTFVAEQGPKIIASPAPNLYVVNVPMMVRSVTFLPSGETFTAAAGLNRAVASLVRAFGAAAGSPVRYSADEVRLALAQSLPGRHEIERVMDALDEVAP